MVDIVEQYVKLNSTISDLNDQASALRQDLLRWGSRYHGAQYEVVVERQTERVFKVERLPDEIRNDPKFWDVASRQEVAVRQLDGVPAFLRPEPIDEVDLLRYRC